MNWNRALLLASFRTRPLIIEITTRRTRSLLTRVGRRGQVAPASATRPLAAAKVRPPKADMKAVAVEHTTFAAAQGASPCIQCVTKRWAQPRRAFSRRAAARLARYLLAGAQKKRCAMSRAWTRPRSTSQGWRV